MKYEMKGTRMRENKIPYKMLPENQGQFEWSSNRQYDNVKIDI